MTLDKKFPLTTKRTSPFMLSQFQSLAPVVPSLDYGILARNLDELDETTKGSLIFKAQIAAAAYAGMFALNCGELGCFSVGVGRDLLPLSEMAKMLPAGYGSAASKPPNDRKDEERTKVAELTKALRRCVNRERGAKLCLLPEERQSRAHDLVAAMADLEGGAHQTRRLYNVAPAAALVAFMDGGNCLPPHIFSATERSRDDYGNATYRFVVDTERLWKVLNDNSHRFLPMPHDGPNLFFGSLGGPAVANEDAVRSLLEETATVVDAQGVVQSPKERGDRFVPGVRVRLCDGPREAIRTAADSIPIEWFQKPEGYESTTDVLYGEALLPTLLGDVRGT